MPSSRRSGARLSTGRGVTSALLLWLLVGCGYDVTIAPTPPPPTPSPTPIDADHDGISPSDGDCDDQDPHIYPLAAELCDGRDNNCDGITDGSDAANAQTIYPDEDDDGFGAEAGSERSCEVPSGWTLDGGDCDDDDAAINPAAVEVCSPLTSADEDCDGAIDDADPDVDPDSQDTYYHDLDADGHGDPNDPQQACEDPNTSLDRWVTVGDDCDDTTRLSHPGAEEICDGEDNNCNSEVDDAPVDQVSIYPDVDLDGYGVNATSILACTPPTGWSTVAGDCDDTNPAIHPNAEESCLDPKDMNCDGSVGRVDADADGFAACEDCDDNKAGVNPDAQEVCDPYGIDEDCDHLADDADGSVAAASKSDWYPDADGDSYGDPTRRVQACVKPSQPPSGGGVWLLNGGDCDDLNAAINPGAAETCDGRDNNCDGQTDPPTAIGALPYPVDADDDGFGHPTLNVLTCTPGNGSAENALDCDDHDPDISPDAAEICAVDGPAVGIDEDCDGDADCHDADCAGAPGCVEVCSGGEDDDNDGDIDCDDADCKGGPECSFYLGQIIFTEIMADPGQVGDSKGEWVELYNTSQFEVNLSGWILKDDDIDKTTLSPSAPLRIPSLGFLVIGRSTNPNANGGAPVAWAPPDGELLLSNDDDELVLQDPDNHTIDRVRYTNGKIHEGESRSLSPLAFDFRANDEDEAWCAATSTFGDGDLGTPGAANDVCAP